MSVLIKEMDMPTTHEVVVHILPDGTASIHDIAYTQTKETIAFEVPTPHGRLIDIGDAMNALGELKRIYVGSVFDNLINDAARNISECQTILEAEE